MPLAEHDLAGFKFIRRDPVSIHVPLAEHDPGATARAGAAQKFQFTCPSRSTTPAGFLCWRKNEVSIHVPLAEHDIIMM